MSSLDLRRCRHCVKPLVSIPVDAAEFARKGPAVVCDRCDGEAPNEERLFLPRGWD